MNPIRRWFEANPLRYLFVGLLLFWGMVTCSVVQAGEGALTWTAPTKRCDGTPLTNLTGYSLTYGQAQQDLPLTPTNFTVRGLSPGVWWFSLAAVDANNERSEFITVSKTVAPEDFKTIATDVFTIVKRTDRFVLLKVGTVPLGTVCIPDQTINGHYAVPRSAVTWSALVRPDVVVAQCG